MPAIPGLTSSSNPAGKSEINGCGLQLCEADVEKLKTRIRSLNEKDVLILSGSVPAGMDSMFYRHLLDLTKDSVLSAVDATGDLLAPYPRAASVSDQAKSG